MKKRITFLVIKTKTGAQKRFTISRQLFYGIITASLLLLGTGIIGAWKYRENAVLKREALLLEAEKGQLQAVTRTVGEISGEEKAIRQMLGLEELPQKTAEGGTAQNANAPSAQ